MTPRTWTTNDLMSRPGAPELVMIQVRVPPGQRDGFEEWLRRYNSAVELVEGHLDYDLTRPTPGFEEDYVLVHRFTDRAAATAWVTWGEHGELIEAVRELVTRDVDVHLYTSDPRRRGRVSALFTTQVEPEREAEFLEWSTRVAAAQAAFAGFIGYQLERPIEGIQPEWVAILTYDTDAHMRAWLSSPERAALLADSASFDERARVHIVRNDLDAWFNAADRSGGAPVWKRNMLVLLVLYPVVFLTAWWVQRPLLVGNGMPLWLALFVANVLSVVALGWVLVPAVGRRFEWWLYPAGGRQRRTTAVGVVVVTALYGLSLLLAWWISSWPFP